MDAHFHHLFDTAIGKCGLAWSDHGLTRLLLPDADGTRIEARLVAIGGGPCAFSDAPEPVRDVVALLRVYCEGVEVTFDAVKLDARRITAQEARIYAALRQVPRGTTTTYGALAVAAGMPATGARAVGIAMARNPWPVIVPCHRVLASGGQLGGFSAPGGTRTKERLLMLEGVALDGGMPMLPGLF